LAAGCRHHDQDRTPGSRELYPPVRPDGLLVGQLGLKRTGLDIVFAEGGGLFRLRGGTAVMDGDRVPAAGERVGDHRSDAFRTAARDEGDPARRHG